MSKVCPITGKKAQTGHNVSHSQRHTKRKFQPNLVNTTIVDGNGRKTRVRISTKALRNLDRDQRIK
jgi:large subunit ribosomal protein L28